MKTRHTKALHGQELAGPTGKNASFEGGGPKPRAKRGASFETCGNT